MDMRIGLLAALCLIGCAQTAVRTPGTVLFDGGARGDWTLSAWGGSSSAEVAGDAGCIHVQLAGESAYFGAELVGRRPLDLSSLRETGCLSFSVRGPKGGEAFSVLLRDATEQNGNEGYFSSVESSTYVGVTKDWQTVLIPLRDFPAMGENWTLPDVPRRRPVDWRRINMVGFVYDRPTEFDLGRIAITGAGRGQVALVSPLTVTDRVDFARGGQAAIAARFSSLADWRIEVTQGAASASYSGMSAAVDQKWDGRADKGEFAAGPAEVVLSYRPAGGEGDWAQARAGVSVTAAHSPRVQVNQVGYLPGDGKTAYVTGLEAARAFTVRTADGAVFTQGRATEPEFYALAGERVAKIDLSSLRNPGAYSVEVDGVGRSFPFTVGEGVYDELWRATMKSYYYQRCGMDLTESHAGIWMHRACHTEDAYVYAGFADGKIVDSGRVPSTGGWHDAGDYGKKVPPAATALFYLLRLAEMFPDRVRALPLNVPGDAALPGYLREVKYELDWLFTMQREDGAVHQLITSTDFYSHGMPEQDLQRRYMVQASSCATADFAAAMAAASRVYRSYDAAYADKCLTAARRAWACLAAHPDIFPAGGYTDPPGINGTGTYDDKDDRDERFWAACELYVTTHEGAFLDYVKAHRGEWTPLARRIPSWMEPHLYGVYSITLDERADAQLRTELRADLISGADHLLDVVQRSPYGMTIDDEHSWWSNVTILEGGAELLMAHRLTGRQAYADAALVQMGYVLGCNPMDWCYVSGFGLKSTRDIWQAASANDGIAAPIPGFAVPGPCLVAWDPKMKDLREQNGLPIMKTYRDDHTAYSVNEVCLPFEAPMVFCAGYFAAGR
jgi:endoglucanase